VVASLLIGAGVMLLIAGGVLAYPYIDSRLSGPRRTPVQTAGTDQPPISSPTSDPSEPGPTRRPTSVYLSTPETSPTSMWAIISGVAPNATTSALAPTTQKPKTTSPSRIVIPALSVDAPVVPLSPHKLEVEGEMHEVWEVPNDYAAGWHRTSATIGEGGNVVLNGHNTNYGEGFRDLYRLHVGDEIILCSQQISRAYSVYQTLILPEGGQPLKARLANARYVMPTEDERLTLVTCHPYGSLRNRLIVLAQPTGSDTGSRPSEDWRPERVLGYLDLAPQRSTLPRPVTLLTFSVLAVTSLLITG